MLHCQRNVNEKTDHYIKKQLSRIGALLDYHFIISKVCEIMNDGNEQRAHPTKL